MKLIVMSLIELKLLILSLLPLVELRGTIPIGMAAGLPIHRVFIICFIGSMMPVPLLFLIMPNLIKSIKSTVLVDKFISRWVRRTLKKSNYLKRYGFLGLLIFVAIPLPGTGVWSGVLVAILMDIQFKKSFILIAIGNLIAGWIVIFLSQGFVSVLAYICN